MVEGYLVEVGTEEEAQWSKRSGLQVSNSVTAWRLKVLLEGRDPYRGERLQADQILTVVGV